MSSLMSNEAWRSLTRKPMGDIRCKHCGHEGPSRIERSGSAHFICAVLLLIVGFLLFWPLMIAGVAWLVFATANSKRHVCMQCHSTDYVEVDH